MAVDMSQESVNKILTELYGTSLVYKQAQALMNSGAKLTFGLFQFKVQVAPDAVFTAQLPAMSTKIVGGGLPTAQKQLIATKLASVINSAYSAKFGSVAPEVVPSFGGTVATPEGDKGPNNPSIEDVLSALKSVVNEAPVKMGVDPASVPYKEPVKPKMPFMKPNVEAVKAQMYGAGAGGAKTEEVIALRDAKAIGQKVKGTSGGSVYNAVAIGPINFAVKFTASNCSIRAESPEFTLALKKKLKDAGFTDNGTYFSMHLKLNGVNAMRAIGAVLYSMDLPFEAVGTTTAQVVS